MRNGDDWTEQEEAELTRRWEQQKQTASQIAKEMKKSRNAVIGKVHRMGLSRRYGYHYDLDKPRPKRRAAFQPPVREPPLNLKPTEATDLREVGAPAMARLVPLMELEPGWCRWPVGTLYCASDAIPRSAYCAYHHRISAHGVQRSRKAERPESGEDGTPKRGAPSGSRNSTYGERWV